MFNNFFENQRSEILFNHSVIEAKIINYQECSKNFFKDRKWDEAGDVTAKENKL